MLPTPLALLSPRHVGVGRGRACTFPWTCLGVHLHRYVKSPQPSESPKGENATLTCVCTERHKHTKTGPTRRSGCTLVHRCEHTDMPMLTRAGAHAHRQACTQRPVHPDAHTYTHERVLTFVHRCARTRSFMYPLRWHAKVRSYTCTHTDIIANLPVCTPIHKHTHVHLVLHVCVSSRWQAGDSTPPVTQLCRAWGWAQPHLSPLLGGEEEVSWAWGAPGAPPVGRTCSAQGRIPSLCAAPCCSRLPRVGPGRGSGEGLRGRTLTPGWELAVLPPGQGEGFAVKVTTPLLF